MIDPYAMEELCYSRTELTPRIRFDPQENVFEISGDSRPEGGVYFFLPIATWIKENGAEAFSEDTRFDFKVDYFNSSSFKGFYEIITAIMKVTQLSASRCINWYYSDEDNKVDGEELAEECDTQFNYIFQEEL